MTIVPTVACIRKYSVSNPSPGMKWFAIAFYVICCFNPGFSFVIHSSSTRRALSKANVRPPNNDDTNRSKLSSPSYPYKNFMDEALTKAMGMAFDSKRQRWVRGKIPTGAEVTSFGGRRLDVVDIFGDDLVEPRPAVAAAAEYLQETVRAARQEAMEIQPTFIQRITLSRAGMYAWAIGQALAMLIAARVMVSSPVYCVRFETC